MLRRLSQLVVGLGGFVALAAFAGEASPDPEVVKQVESGAELLKKDKLEEAGQLFLDVLRDHPGSPLPALGLMKVASTYVERDEAEKGMGWLNRTLEVAEKKGELHILAATIYIREEDRRKALDHLRKGLVADGDSPAMLGAALTCYARMEQFDEESRKVAEHLLAVQEPSVGAHLFLGLWHQNNEDYKKARWHLLRAVFLDTNNIQSRLALGKFYEKTEKYDLAEREYIKMTKIAPAHFSGYLCLAELYEKTGKERMAEEYAREAARLKEALAEFERGEADKAAEDK